MKEKETKAKKKTSNGVTDYVLPLIFVSLLPVFWFYLCSNFKFAQLFPNWVKYSDAVDAMSALILFLFLIFFFTFTVGYTIFVMKSHWSKTLDNFFNKIQNPTVLFVIAMIIVFLAEYKGFFVGCESDALRLLLHNFYVSTIPCYCTVYFVILIVYICRKKIPNFKL